MRIIIYLCLLRLPLLEADAAVVVTYRGGDPNIFPVSSLPSSGSLDINDDGVDDFHFWRDAGFVSGMQGYGTNRIISTLAISPDQGTYVSPVFAGDILGSNTTFLSGDWHHHTDNISNPITNSYSSLGRMQSQDAYIGVEFDIDGSTHYGWIQYTGFYVAEFTFFSPDGPITFIGANFLGGFINSWGYETEPDVSIIAGIPEPSTGLLLMLGGIALVGRRTRKKRSTTRRDTATPISRPVFILFRRCNLHPVIDVRRR